MAWRIVVVNDPENDYNLVFEVLQGDAYVGRLQYSKHGEVELWLFNTSPVTVPWAWLRDRAEQYQKEVPFEPADAIAGKAPAKRAADGTRRSR